MRKPLILAVSIAALLGVSLVANAACRSADGPAPSPQLPDLAPKLSAPECPDLVSQLAAQPCPDLAARLSAVAAVAPPPPSDKLEPAPDESEPQTFCCSSVGKGSEKKGEGRNCTTISPDLVNLCDKVLHCPGAYIKDGDKIECL